MAKRDYYEILGVDKSADKTAIKKAYRKKAMEFHPDRNPDNPASEAKFKEAAEAYDVLSDPDKKARYDRFGHQGMGQGGGGGGFQGGSYTMEDIFEQFGDVFGGGGGSGFESFFGGGRAQSRSGGKKGSNLHIKVELSLEEIAKGITKKIKVKKAITCNSCQGSGAKDANSVSTCGTCRGSGYVKQVRSTFLGQMQTTVACPSCQGAGKTITAKCGSCHGTGTKLDFEVISIDIPAGVSDEMQLSLRGKGNAGQNGGPSGDLLMTIKQKPHQFFRREGNHVIYDLHLSYADVALGCSVEVPTLTGKAKIKIDEGTTAGKILRLRGKGFPSVQSYETGDQLVVVNIWSPKKLTKEEKDLLKKMQKMPNFNPPNDSKAKSGHGFFDKLENLFR